MCHEQQGRRSGLTRTKAVSSRLYGDVAIAGEACPATALGITLHNNIVRWNAWSTVRGSSVFMDSLGTVGNKSISACAPKNIVGVVPETRNEGCRPSHGAAAEHDEYEIRRSSTSLGRTGNGFATVDHHKRRNKVTNTASLLDIPRSTICCGYP